MINNPIVNSLKEFLKDRNANERYASFDYCFNYFQSFKDKTEDLNNEKNLQQSCLHLGFYLASWGMFRGSSFILQKSVHYFKKVIEEIIAFDKAIWEIDVNNYSDDNIQILLAAKEKINLVLGGKASDILTTKIMLGVFGNIPAFDTNFQSWLHCSSCGEKELKKISEFYQKSKNIIDEYSDTTFTLDFYTGKDTKRNYTKAKVIDMAGFIEGQNIQKKKEEERKKIK